MVLRAVPRVAVVVIAVLASGVAGTLSQFTASITNPDNAVRSGSVSLTETGTGGKVCSAPGDGQWRDCGTVDKFGGGTLRPGVPVATTVTLQNTGASSARLYLLPSQCRDTLTGAHGALCGQATVEVRCGGTVVVSARTLNAFHDSRNFPTGYPAGTLAASTAVSCVFTLVAASIPVAGSVSQPISWTLIAGT
jgi:hypothetical protein